MLQGAVRLGALTRESVLTETMYDNLSNQHNHRVKASIADNVVHIILRPLGHEERISAKRLFTVICSMA